MLQGSLGVFLENGYTNMIYVERSCFCSKKHDFEYMFVMAFVNILGRDTRPIFRLDEVKKLKEIYCSMEDDLCDLSGGSCCNPWVSKQK